TANVPYLFADDDLVEKWRGALKKLDGFKVGIAWQGDPKHQEDRQRSIPLRFFKPLAEVSEVRLISLQKGAGTEQLRDMADAFAVTVLADQVDEATGPFMDTAAIIKGLDLV